MAETNLTDAEKLIAFAREVETMINLQKEYFKVSKLGREGKAASDEVKKALSESIKQESRVKQLVKKVLQPQAQIFGS